MVSQCIRLIEGNYFEKNNAQDYTGFQNRFIEEQGLFVIPAFNGSDASSSQVGTNQNLLLDDICRITWEMAAMEVLSNNFLNIKLLRYSAD